MAVEAVAYIFPVRNIFNNSVFFTELLYLHPTEILCRRSVNGVQMPVFFFEFIDLIINVI